MHIELDVEVATCHNPDHMHLVPEQKMARITMNGKTAEITKDGHLYNLKLGSAAYFRLTETEAGVLLREYLG